LRGRVCRIVLGVIRGRIRGSGHGALLELGPVGVGVEGGRGGRGGAAEARAHHHPLHLHRGGKLEMGRGELVLPLVLLSLPRLHAVLLQRDRPRLVVDLLVESARVAHNVSGHRSSPQRRCHRVAIGARCAFPSARGDPRVLGFHQRPICPVHLVVEAASVAEVVARCVSAPERR